MQTHINKTISHSNLRGSITGKHVRLVNERL